MKATATQVKNRFGEFLDHVIREPVEVQKSGRSVAVLISRDEYERLSALEDRYWGERAREASEYPYVGHEETTAAIAGRMKAVEQDTDAS